MEITIKQEQARVPVTVFQLVGDMTSEEPMKTKVKEAQAAGTRNLLIDLTHVRYMSSSGLRALHGAFMLLRGSEAGESKEAMSSGIASGTFTSPHVKLLKPSEHVLQVLKTAGFDMFLEIFTDYKTALASF